MPRRNRVTALWLLVCILRLSSAFNPCRSYSRPIVVHDAHRESTLLESAVSRFGQNDGGHSSLPQPAEAPPSVDEDFVQDFLRLRTEIRKYSNSDLYRKYSAIIPMTVNILRREYGERANWWGDLSASETRLLYWRLLPSVLLIEEEFKELPLKDRAYIASMARYAAKLYARERSMVPERAAVSLFDATRSVLKTGKWSWTGLSVEDIWLKYEREIKAELEEESWMRDATSSSSSEFAGTATLDSDLGSSRSSSTSASSSRSGSEYSSSSSRGFESQAEADRELYRRLYQRIIQRSCATNPMVDRLAMLTPSKVAGDVFSILAPPSSGKAKARQRANSAAETAERAAFMDAQNRAADFAAIQEARLLGEAQLVHDGVGTSTTTVATADVIASTAPGSAAAAAESLAEKQRSDRLLRLLRTMRFKDKVTRIMASTNFASLLAFDRAKNQSAGKDDYGSENGGLEISEDGASGDMCRSKEDEPGTREQR